MYLPSIMTILISHHETCIIFKFVESDDSDICDYAVAPLISELENEFTRDMTLQIHCHTASHNHIAALAIADVLANNRVKSHFRGFGQIGIFGLIVAQACTTSTISRNSRVCIPKIAINLNGDFTLYELQTEYRLLAKTRDRILELLQPRDIALESPSIIPHWLDEWWEGSSEEAVHFGLFTEISDEIRIREGTSSIYS
jgi:ATP-dependent protease ClpP protease subunit